MARLGTGAGRPRQACSQVRYAVALSCAPRRALFGLGGGESGFNISKENLPIIPILVSRFHGDVR